MSQLPADIQAKVDAQSSDAAYQSRYIQTMQMVADVAQGKPPTESQLVATMSTVLTIAAVAAGAGPEGAALGALFVVMMGALELFQAGFMWLAEQLGFAAGAGPGWCADPSRVPSGPDDPRWVHASSTPPTSDFERYAFPLLNFDWELANNCRSNVLTPAAFDALVSLYNAHHSAAYTYQLNANEYVVAHSGNVGNATNPLAVFFIETLGHGPALESKTYRINAGPLTDPTHPATTPLFTPPGVPAFVAPHLPRPAWWKQQGVAAGDGNGEGPGGVAAIGGPGVSAPPSDLVKLFFLFMLARAALRKR